MVVLFSITTQFAEEYMPSNVPSPAKNEHETSTTKGSQYPMFQDTHVMMAIGFGFLYTGMRRYAWSGVGINYLLCACTFQWAILCDGFWKNIVSLHHAKPAFKIPLDLHAVINADYAVATVLISFGALIGRLSPTQAVWMSFVETIFCTAIVAIGATLGVSDAGDPCSPVSALAPQLTMIVSFYIQD
jgi:ammonium transporter Rh